MDEGGYDIPIVETYSLMIQTSLTIDGVADDLIDEATARFPEIEMFMVYELVANSMATDHALSEAAQNRLAALLPDVDHVTANSIAIAYHNIGVGLSKQRNLDAAVAAFTRALSFMRISEQSYHPFRSKVTTDFGAKLPPVSV